MMRNKFTKILILLLVLFSCTLSAQIKYDTLIKTVGYSSYYSYQHKAPVIVSYKLYKGGGDCSRTGNHFRFINSLGFENEAKPKDYAKSGYDEGHMANAEDFAFDCILEENTFRFYNAVPQTPENNRGIWKHYETETRKLSQTDSLLVVCYNHFSADKLNQRIAIPDTNYKFVYSLTTHELLLSVGICNTALPIESKPNKEIENKVHKAIKH
ncbi:MAG TPA: DNA/RNA non-specific endonuclease [Bacteroidia bacterium]|jgi:endonuclease G|nr:DNA/RNA non-specific endonuclease [Bacteroidia bacterium]